MDYPIINGVINKPILSGFEFDILMPKSNCKILKKRKNLACNAIEEVVSFSRNYIFETEELSKCFVGMSIINTCHAVQYFLSSHIRYSYNDNNKIKTPSCVWSTRTADCKSFTVFASTILYNLGIKHYLKVVSKKHGNDAHIYVIVPFDQESNNISPSSLYNVDYCVVDGTFDTGKYYELKQEKTHLIIPMNSSNINKRYKCLSPSKFRKKILWLSVAAAFMLVTNNSE